jgi:hypothetical protein
MRRWAFLAAIIVGAGIGGLGALLRDEPVTIGPLASMALASEQSFLNGVARQTAPASAFSRVLMADLAPMGQDNQATRRSPPVTGTDRRVIADSLNAIRELPAKPRLVVLDVDIAPLANAANFGPAEEESTLIEALSAWRADAKAPPLLLVRGEGCGPPVSHAAAALPDAWQSTPYDAMVAPTSRGATQIAWACALPSPSRDGAVRRFHPSGCVSQRDDWSDRFPMPSPGQWAASGLRDADTPDLSRTYQTLRNDLDPLCLQDTAGGQVARPLPLVQRHHQGSSPQTIAWTDLTESRSRDLSGALVVIGRFDSRAGDLWVGPSGERVPGAQLIAAQIDTMLRFRNGAKLDAVEGASLALGLGGLLGAVYWGIRSVRKPLVNWLGTKRMGRPLLPLARRLLSAPALGFVLSTAATVGLVNVAPIVSPESWPILWYVAVGCSLAMALLDMALKEEKA